MKRAVAIDVNDLEAQFLGGTSKTTTKSPAFIVGDDFDSDFEGEAEGAPVTIIKKTFTTAASASTPTAIPAAANNQNQRQFSYASATGASVTVEELEAKLVSAVRVSPKSQVIGAGPPPGLPPGLTAAASTNPNLNSIGAGRTVETLSGFGSILPPSSSASASAASSYSNSFPLQRNDPNKEFMNRFERNLIMKIHTTQLTTETPLMDDFYYQALAKKKKSETGTAGTAGPNGQLLYFPLPSAAERQKELQRRERRRKLREKERDNKDTENAAAAASANPTPSPAAANTSEISADLVLGKVSHSTSRKPRQQLKVPANLSESSSAASGADKSSFSLHEKVVMGIEEVYLAILSIEDFYLSQEEQQQQQQLENKNKNDKNPADTLDALVSRANSVILEELNLNPSSAEKTPNHTFIHFLTIPKGRAIVSRLLKVLNTEGRGRFLENLVEYFDFMEIVRPETSLLVVDSFISQVLSPLVAFVGEADWSIVMSSLATLFGKRSFVWIALTKAGMVLLCILLSRLEILKGLDTEPHGGGDLDSAALLTEKVYDSLEGHLLELFSLSDPSRDFYAWQFLALLAMNVESDRKRSMILELRDKILVVVESGEEKGVRNLNVFLNALGLDASQLK